METETMEHEGAEVAVDPRVFSKELRSIIEYNLDGNAFFEAVIPAAERTGYRAERHRVVNVTGTIEEQKAAAVREIELYMQFIREAEVVLNESPLIESPRVGKPEMGTNVFQITTWFHYSINGMRRANYFILLINGDAVCTIEKTGEYETKRVPITRKVCPPDQIENLLHDGTVTRVLAEHAGAGGVVES